MSYVLRVPSWSIERDPLSELVRQLAGSSRCRPIGFGAKRPRSLPDRVPEIMASHVAEAEPDASESFPSKDQLPLRFGDECPECGAAAVVAVEESRKCRWRVCGVPPTLWRRAQAQSFESAGAATTRSCLESPG